MMFKPTIGALLASSTTLVLVDGRRAVGQGVVQTSVDPNKIPPRMLGRVDVIPDGGSSIYGSDAIGDVVNFTTRKRFNGLEAGGQYDLTNNYLIFDGNVTAGNDCGSGSFIPSYAYAGHSDPLGGNRNYITQDHRAQGSTDQRATTCSPGKVTAGSVVYMPPGCTPETNLCDTARQVDMYPDEQRHSVFASLTQDLTDSLCSTSWAKLGKVARIPRSPSTSAMPFNQSPSYLNDFDGVACTNVGPRHHNGLPKKILI